jgi:hypothetical protein
VAYRKVTYDVHDRRILRLSCAEPKSGDPLTSLTPYSESLERVRSVLVFFAATGSANAAVLAELESEVRITVNAARSELVPVEDVRADLDRLASVTLPASTAATASRLLNGWAVMAFDRSPIRPAQGRDELRS